MFDLIRQAAKALCLGEWSVMLERENAETEKLKAENCIFCHVIVNYAALCAMTVLLPIVLSLVYWFSLSAKFLLFSYNHSRNF